MKKLKTKLIPRKKDANKGDFGHLFVLAGSSTMTGAAYLCAKAALVSGTGLITVGMPKSAWPILAVKLTEAMTLPLSETSAGSLGMNSFKDISKALKRADVLAIGPGLSQHLSTQRLIRKIISEIDIPMIIDADAINALAGNLDILKKNPCVRVITPHPGEMSRLLGEKTTAVQKNRRTLAKKFSCGYNMITVLKGSQTIVASPTGEIFVNTTGNPGMAKGGTGDVLTGIIAAFIAQGQNAFEAAELAVYAHGLAADIAVKQTGQISLLATDIINALPEAFKKIKVKH